MCNSITRHAWLESARVYCTSLLALAGYEVPAKVRVSIGFPFATRKAIGQCWQAEACTDEHHEIMVSPVRNDGPDILATLLHELIHASLPQGSKHGPAFKKAALAVGLAGKMTATRAGDELKARLEAYCEDNLYPAGAINTGASGRKVQTTRMIKTKCAECGYLARVARAWLIAKGAPHCPEHGEMEIV